MEILESIAIYLEGHGYKCPIANIIEILECNHIPFKSLMTLSKVYEKNAKDGKKFLEKLLNKLEIYT